MWLRQHAISPGHHDGHHLLETASIHNKPSHRIPPTRTPESAKFAPTCAAKTLREFPRERLKAQASSLMTRRIGEAPIDASSSYRTGWVK